MPGSGVRETRGREKRAGERTVRPREVGRVGTRRSPRWLLNNSSVSTRDYRGTTRSSRPYPGLLHVKIVLKDPTTYTTRCETLCDDFRQRRIFVLLSFPGVGDRTGRRG